VVPEAKICDAEDKDLINVVLAEAQSATANVEKLDAPKALNNIFNIFSKANKYIEVTEPYILAKDPEKKDKLNTVLRNLLEAIRIGTLHLSAFMPETTAKVLGTLGVEASLGSAEFYRLQEGKTLEPLGILFPRLDVEKELEILTSL
jgi:methionyl-tRNA synthetase